MSMIRSAAALVKMHSDPLADSADVAVLAMVTPAVKLMLLAFGGVVPHGYTVAYPATVGLMIAIVAVTLRARESMPLRPVIGSSVT
jgi:hypothetical protein